MTRPVALFGGTFDPVHFGHLRPAVELQQVLDAAELRFIPCQIPPLKDAATAPADVRLEMLRAAVHDLPGCSVDPRELQRDGPSYTVTTLEELRSEDPGRRLCLVIGLDAFLALPTWHRWEAVLELTHFAVTSRPGWRCPEPLPEWWSANAVSDPSALRERAAGDVCVHLSRSSVIV